MVYGGRSGVPTVIGAPDLFVFKPTLASHRRVMILCMGIRWAAEVCWSLGFGALDGGVQPGFHLWNCGYYAGSPLRFPRDLRFRFRKSTCGWYTMFPGVLHILSIKTVVDYLRDSNLMGVMVYVN